jgi:Animal haem peroxidase
VEKHGSETYFVLGEGLLGETVGGREATLEASVEAAAPPFRFSRMGPSGIGRQLGEATRRRIGEAVAAGGGGASRIPAGFTYLGQFVDHDLTFDKTSVMLGENVSPTQLLQARSPSLDLDALYGAGPGDPASARFYVADGTHLKMGTTATVDGILAKAGFDLPRGAGSTVAAKRRAIIPDPRNDENLAVAQTHLAFVRFHNRVVDTLPASVPPAQRFARARELVTKHYQWMLRTDYLPRICARAVVTDVFGNGRKAFEVGAPPTAVPTMPIEFSVAAFRLGHWMIRPAYNWNRVFDTGRARSTCCSSSPQGAEPSAAVAGFRATGSPTFAGSSTSTKQAGRTSPSPQPNSTAPCGSTRRWRPRYAPFRASRPPRPTSRSAT